MYTKYFLHIDILRIESYTSFTCWLYKFISKLPELMIVLSEFELMHVDEFIDELLHSERVCDIILPRLQVRDKGDVSYQSCPSLPKTGRQASTHTQ